MKKLILFLSLLSSIYAFDYDAHFYTGIGGGVQRESFNDDQNSKNTPTFGSLKFGYGDIRAYAIELSLDYIDNKSNIFSKQDKKRYGLNVAFVKAFNFTKRFYPFVRAGFGAGEMKVDRTLEDRIAYSSYNLGLGLFIPIFSHIDLETAYEYRFTSYQSVDLVAKKLKLQSHINQIYLGLNFRF